MKKKIVFIPAFLFLSIAFQLSAQQNTWTWMKGDSLPNQTGVSGTLGVPSPANKPHARYEACQWTDQQGNFWMYGGGIVNARYSDLWRFEPATNNWTWMHGTQMLNQQPVYGTKGISDPLNTPGGNGFAAATWTDLIGNLWMYGGHDGSDSYNLLWKYDVVTNEWTWVHGDTIPNTIPNHGTKGISSPANTPGSRCETACAWTDNSGDLWLFGGTTGGAGVCFNDLWKYNIVSNEWTWMSGDNIPNQMGVYGTRGVPGPSNKPRSRWCYTSWKDSTGNLWLFGGIEASSIIGMSYFNDLWKYDIASNAWTWMSGSNQLNQNGFYGTQCTASTITTPGSRGECRACWKDDCNNFWLFGGRDLNFNLYNDLWRYNVTMDRWYWVSGSNTVNQSSVFGTQQVPSPSNVPAGRMGAVSWKNNNGFWLFGGMDYGGSEWNDLWKFSVEDSTCGFCAIQPLALFSSPNSICPGACTDFINQSIGATSYVWNFPGGNPSSSTDVNPNVCYNNPGNYDVTLIASNSLTSDTLTLINYVTVFPVPLPQGILQSGDSLIANQGSAGYQWFYNGNAINGATNYFYVATQSGNYSVVAVDVNGCEVEAVINDVIASSNQFAVGSLQLAISPNPVSEMLYVNSYKNALKHGGAEGLFGTADKDISISIYNTIGSAVNLPTADCQLPSCSLDVSSLPHGLYFLCISINQESVWLKFIKQ